MNMLCRNRPVYRSIKGSHMTPVARQSVLTKRESVQEDANTACCLPCKGPIFWRAFGKSFSAGKSDKWGQGGLVTAEIGYMSDG